MWKRLTLNFLSLISLFFYSYTICAEELAFSRNARTFESQQSSLVMKGLAHSCLSIFHIPDGIPCNPSMIKFIPKSSLGLGVLISNGYASIDSVRQLLREEISQELVDSLFSTNQILQIESNVEVNFLNKYFTARYTPATVKGHSILRNEANPEAELYFLEEQGFTFQTGYSFDDWLLLGAQFRFIDRKFIRQRFKLIDLATVQGQGLLKPKEQTAFYYEPSLTVLFGGRWKPRVSLFYANLGHVSEKFDGFDIEADPQLGFGVSPPIAWGELNLTLEFRKMKEEESFQEKLRLGALYRFGAMYLSGGIDSNGLSGGIFYGLESLNAGVLYTTTKSFGGDEEFFTQTVYVQVGWQI